jgi:hypothetical protein
MITKQVDKATETRILILRTLLHDCTREKLGTLPENERRALINAAVELNRLVGACTRVTPIEVKHWLTE